MYKNKWQKSSQFFPFCSKSMKKACYNKNQNDQHSINMASNQNSTVGL